MIHVRSTTELPADETGPYEVYTERFELPEGWARDAREAREKFLTLLVTESYGELPTRDSWVPFRTETVREVWVWQSSH